MIAFSIVFIAEDFCAGDDACFGTILGALYL